MSLLVILAIFGSVQNILFSDSVRNWGEIRFISSKADFLTPEKIEQNWGRNTPVLYTNCCFKGLSEPISQLYKNLGFYIFLAVFLKTYHLQGNFLKDYRIIYFQKLCHMPSGDQRSMQIFFSLFNCHIYSSKTL